MIYKNFFIFILHLFLLVLSSCTHTNSNKYSKPSIVSLDKNKELQLYKLLEDEIKSANASELKECNCMKAFYRNLFENPDKTARYAFDRKVGEHAVAISKNQKTVSILAIGSGKLLNDLTAFANILARGKNLDIYLMDYAYVFYGDNNFKEKAIKFGKHPKLIPEGWKDFYFWGWYKSKKEPYLPFFEEHHTAIDKFKKIIKNIGKFYGTNTKINILKPASVNPIQLPELDMVIVIDAFLDIPNVMWNLFYRMKLSNMPVRFLILNKAKPLGGFWESPDLSIREKNSLETVSIDIYDVKSNHDFGSYKLVEKVIFKASEYQLKNSPEFKNNPKRDSTQSPLDITKKQ